MEALLTNKLIKNFADSYSPGLQTRAIKAALILGIQRLREQTHLPSLSIEALEELIIFNEEDYVDRKINQLTTQVEKVQEEVEYPLNHRKTNLRRVESFSPPQIPPMVQSAREKSGSGLKAFKGQQKSQMRRTERDMRGSSSLERSVEKKNKKIQSMRPPKGRNFLVMTKPPSDWRKGDDLVFTRCSPKNPWVKKRLSNSVEQIVYPKWWPAQQGGSGGTGEDQSLQLQQQSPQPHTFRGDDRAQSIQVEPTRQRTTSYHRSKKPGKEERLYVRTKDQHLPKTALTNPFAPLKRQRKSETQRMPLNLKNVESKIKRQVAQDKERSRIDKLVNQRMGKQSARVELHVPDKPVPIREPSPKREETDDGYMPGQSALYEQDQEQEEDYEMSGEEGGPVQIAQQALNSPLMHNFQEPHAPQQLNPHIMEEGGVPHGREDISSATKSPENAFERYFPSSGGQTQAMPSAQNFYHHPGVPYSSGEPSGAKGGVISSIEGPPHRKYQFSPPESSPATQISPKVKEKSNTRTHKKHGLPKKKYTDWVGEYRFHEKPRDLERLAQSNTYTYNAADLRRAAALRDSFPDSTEHFSHVSPKGPASYSSFSGAQPYAHRSGPTGTAYSGFSSDLGVREHTKQEYDPYYPSSFNYNRGYKVQEPLRQSRDHRTFSAARERNILDDSALIRQGGKSPSTSYNPARSQTFEQNAQQSSSSLSNFTPSEDFKGFFKQEQLGGSLGSSRQDHI